MNYKNKLIKIMFLLTLFVLLFGVTLAEDIVITVDVNSSLPIAVGAALESGTDLILMESENSTFTWTVVIQDGDGFADIDHVEAVFYRTAVTSSATDDPRNHYSATCSPAGDGFENSETYNCYIDIVHYADPTDSGSLYESDDWTFTVTPYDNQGEGTSDSITNEVLTLSSLIIDTTPMAFGSLALGADTGMTNQLIPLSNGGNEMSDIEISSTDFICTTGTIPVDMMKYSAVAFDYAMEGTSLDNMFVELDLDLDRGSDSDAIPTKDIYFGMGFPSSGISGSCSGTISIMAVSDPLND